MHSTATGDSATRGTPTTSLGSSRTPHASASLVPGGKSVPVALICSNSASGVRLTVNSPVASTLRSESFRPDRGELDDRRVDAGHRVEGVRRQVEHAVGRPAAHPGDRAGAPPRSSAPGRRRPAPSRRGRSARGRGSRGRSRAHRRRASPLRRGQAGGRARSGCRAGARPTDRAIRHVEGQHRHRVGQRVGPQPAAGAPRPPPPARRRPPA